MCPSQSAELSCFEGSLWWCNESVCTVLLRRDGYYILHLVFPVFGILKCRVLTCQAQGLMSILDLLRELDRSVY